MLELHSLISGNQGLAMDTRLQQKSTKASCEDQFPVGIYK